MATFDLPSEDLQLSVECRNVFDRQRAAAVVTRQALESAAASACRMVPSDAYLLYQAVVRRELPDLDAERKLARDAIIPLLMRGFEVAARKLAEDVASRMVGLEPRTAKPA